MAVPNIYGLAGTGVESGEERGESDDERGGDDMADASMPVATPDRERELQEGLDRPNASPVPFSPMSDVPPCGGQHDEQHAVPPASPPPTNRGNSVRARVLMRLDYTHAMRAQPQLVSDELRAMENLRADHREACDRIAALQSLLAQCRSDLNTSR
eukprot:158127-Pleurochrysis_carterae.AAC.1